MSTGSSRCVRSRFSGITTVALVVRLAALAFFASTGFARATATDPVFDALDSELWLVQFEGGAILEMPFVDRSRLQVVLADSSIVEYRELGYIRDIVPSIPMGSKGYDLDGPYYVTTSRPEAGAGIIPNGVEDLYGQRPEISVFQSLGSSSGPMDPPLLGEDVKLGSVGELYRSASNGNPLSIFTAFEGLHGFHYPSEDPEYLIDVADSMAVAVYDAQSQYGPLLAQDLDLPQAWGITTGDPSVVVAVIDNGVDWIHSDLYDGLADPALSFEDHMLSSNAPRIFRNWHEGEAGGDVTPSDPAASGAAAIDEDQDGFFDEDPTGLLPGNQPERRVYKYPVASAFGDSIVFDMPTEDHWLPSELVGLQFMYGISGVQSPPAYSERIEKSGPNWIVTTLMPSPFGGDYGYYGWLVNESPTSYFFEGWEDLLIRDVGPNMVGFISDTRDTDRDGVRDDTWEYDSADDDENGVSDDFRGGAIVAREMRTWKQWSQSNDARPEIGENRVHGTEVSGLVAAGTDPAGTGYVGVAPNVSIVPIRYGGNTGALGRYATNMQLARAFEYALSLRDAAGNPVVDIIQLSSGLKEQEVPSAWTCDWMLRRGSDGEFVDPLSRAIERAIDRGVLIVAAAGNTDVLLTEDWFLGCFEEVVIVGGTRVNDQLATGLPLTEQSNHTFGPSIDVLAQSYNIPAIATCLDPVGCTSRYGLQYPSEIIPWEDGTSLATPQVSGLAALLKSAYPTLTAGEIKARLEATAVPVSHAPQFDGNVGAGRINAYRALTLHGDLAQVAADTTWTGDVWVGGDIRLPAGKTLFINPGTTIHIAQDDLLSAGADPNRIEWTVDGTIVAPGTTGNPIIVEIHSDDPGRKWGQFRLLDSTLLEAGTFFVNDLLTRDVVTNPDVFWELEGESAEIAWTADHLVSPGDSTIIYEQSVRVRSSSDAGETFDAGTVVPIGDQSFTWNVPTGTGGTSFVLRVEFLDPAGYVIGFDDLTVHVGTLIAPFDNVSANSGIAIADTDEPYASLALDVEDVADYANRKSDLVLSMIDEPARLYINTGATQMDGATFVDLRQSRLAGGSVQNTLGTTRADIDNDGAQDLLFTGPSGTRLYRGELDAGGAPTGFFPLANEIDVSLVAPGASRAGSWSDYDKDGDLDLYLVRDASDVLLRNDGGTFVDVTAAAGLPTSTTSTNVVAWADVDNDRDLDLVVGWADPVGGAGLGRSALYINSGGATPTFEDRAATGDANEAIPAIGGVRAVKWADVSGDGDLDLILACANGSGQTDGNLLVAVNDGFGRFAIESVERGFYVDENLVSVDILDVDANAVLDIVAVPEAAAPAHVFTGFGGESTRTYFDVGTQSQLGATLSRGVAVFDMNADTDFDVFLLRPGTSSPSHLWANPLFTDMPGPGEERSLTIGFASDGLTANRHGIGATVRVRATQPGGRILRSAQVVDGGSGRGGQSADRLSFGLGQASTAQISVAWPDGSTQVFDAASMAGFPNVTIRNTADPGVIESSVGWSYVLGSDNTTHTFTWRTHLEGGDPRVVVQVLSPNTADCRLPLGGATQLVLHKGMANVSSSSVAGTTINDPADPTDDEFWYQHTLHWSVTCSASCNYRYTVGNSRNGEVFDGPTKTMNVGICGTIFQQ